MSGMLSVIVPAYNEEKVIVETISVLASYLAAEFPDFEIIVVSDGSHDRTYQLARRLGSERIRVFEYRPNQGKGHALRYGVGKARGELVVFYDSGLNFPPSQIGEFLSVLEENNSDLVIGSKRHLESEVDYPFGRKVVSFLAQVLVKILFNLNVTDTQVGLKAFRAEVLDKVMPRVLVKRYAFDVELLALSQHYGFRITEAPVKLDLNFSTAATPSSILETLADTLAVFYRLHILNFYDRSESERARMIREYRLSPLERLFGELARLVKRVTQ